LKSTQEGTIFSWIKEFIIQDELIRQRSVNEEEIMALIINLIRGCAIYGHKKGLRIGGFIEYSTATEDNYIIDAVMKISFREDYSDLEIDVEMAELMVSSLSGKELSLLMREQLNEELKNNGVNKELYDSDKYVWLQTIKETVNQKIKGVKSTKSSLVKEASEAKKASKPTDKAGANMTEEINTDKTEALAAVKDDGWALEHVSDELRADKEVVMAAVQKQDMGSMLMYASEELKADKELVMAAVKSDGGALLYASDELKADKELVMEAVKSGDDVLMHASDELRADKELVMAAVKLYGGALMHASDELRADKEVVMAAVKDAGWALEYASDELKADKEVVMTGAEEFSMEKDRVEEIDKVEEMSVESEELEGIYRCVIMRDGELILNVVYKEIQVGDSYEIWGCYYGSPDHWALFHVDAEEEYPVVFTDWESIMDMEMVKTSMDDGEGVDICNELELLRTKFLEFDENYELLGLSETGQEFVQRYENKTIENEIHSISPTFSYDYIEMIQDQWSVDVRV